MESIIRVGIAGIGRMGKTHANNLAFKIQGAKLAAVCDISNDALAYAKEMYGVKYLYTDFDDMLKNDEIDAVAIITAPSEHCRQIVAALDAGKHVFTDKPMGINVEECKTIEKAVERHPGQVFLVGYMRRYDPDYMYAKELVESGKVGKPFMVRTTGIDSESIIEGTIKFAPTSGGILFDMMTHDIDLMRWYLGAEVTEVCVAGGTYKYREFRDAGTEEAAATLFKFDNGSMACAFNCRFASYGYHNEIDIIGTEGTIRVSPVPARNKTVLLNENGAVIECVDSFFSRYESAYLAEMQEFVNCIKNKGTPKVTVYDGTKSTQVAFAATESMKTGKPVKIVY